MAASSQPSHPPWPHRHVSPEAGAVKVVLVLAVLVGAGIVAAIKAWRRRRQRAEQIHKPRRRRRGG